MAGGVSKRFRPLSTPERPKQFLELYGKGSLLQQTVSRLSPRFLPGQIIVSTNTQYEPLVRLQLVGTGVHRVIPEPVTKNTAPCIALAAWLLARQDPSAILAVFPADHFIGREAVFSDAVGRALRTAAARRALLTIGCPVRSPSTEYGYIKRGRAIDASAAVPLYAADRFTEKPPLHLARAYHSGFDGTYLWNSGMFAWRVDVFLAELKRHLPAMRALLDDVRVRKGRIVQEDLERFFSRAEAISVDYGILERSRRVLALEADMEWSDMGSPEALKKLAQRRRVELNPEIASIVSLPPRRIRQPWGHELIWASTAHYLSKILVIKSGRRLSYQYHERKYESIHVLEGRVELEFERLGRRQTRRLKPGETFHIPPTMKHRMTALSDCHVLEVSTPHPEDVVRLEDVYGRAGLRSAPVNPSGKG